MKSYWVISCDDRFIVFEQIYYVDEDDVDVECPAIVDVKSYTIDLEEIEKINKVIE